MSLLPQTVGFRSHLSWLPYGPMCDITTRPPPVGVGGGWPDPGSPLQCQGPVHTCPGTGGLGPNVASDLCFPAVLKTWWPVCQAVSLRWATWRNTASPSPSSSLRKMGWVWLSRPPRSMSATSRTTWVSAIPFTVLWDWSRECWGTHHRACCFPRPGRVPCVP